MRNINYSFMPLGSLPVDSFITKICDKVENYEVDRLCSLVFAPHPKTGLPCSDLQILFSDSVPAEIADWVRKNLQSEMPLSPSSIVDGHQVDDDTLISLTRNIGESDMSYINRCDGLIRDYIKNDSKFKEGN